MLARIAGDLSHADARVRAAAAIATGRIGGDAATAPLTKLLDDAHHFAPGAKCRKLQIAAARRQEHLYPPHGTVIGIAKAFGYPLRVSREESLQRVLDTDTCRHDGRRAEANPQSDGKHKHDH